MNISAASYNRSFGNGNPAEYEVYDKDGTLICAVGQDGKVYNEDTAYKDTGVLNNDYQENKVIELCDEYLNKSTKSQDLKNPLLTLGSIGVAIIGTYAVGKRVANTITQLPFSFVTKAPVAIEKGLKTGSLKMQSCAKKLMNEAPSKNLDKIKNIAGKSISKAEDAARTIYKKIAYSTIPNEITNPERARKAIVNVAGTAAAISVVPQIISNDHNNDGVKDIAQRSQNAYTGTSNKLKESVSNITMLGEIIEALT